MRTYQLLGLSTATALSAVLACAPLAQAATPTLARDDVFTLTATNTQTTDIPAPAQGAEFTVADDLLRDNEKVGHGGINCTFVRTTPTTDVQCLATFSLADGDITAQGVLRFTGEAPDDFNLAINGGTGTYRDHSGFIHGHVIPNSENTELTFHVIS